MQLRLLQTDDAKTTILIRLMVGAVFLAEGIQKFLYPAMRGQSRFEGMGFPAPEFFGNFVGSIFLMIKGGGRWSIDRQSSSKVNE